MREEKLFSFAVITYKRFGGVIKTVESVFQQDYPRIELILSDDGSENYYDAIDEIRSYIEANKPENVENIVYSHLPQNQGTVKNINNAVNKANGEFFKALGGGDVLACPDALSRYARYLEEHKVRIVFSKLEGITRDGTIVKHLASCEENYDLLRSFSCEQLCDRLCARNCLPAPAWCATRELFERNGFFHEDVKLIEDYPYWITLCRNQEKIGFMDDVLIRYQLDGVSSAGSYGVQFMKDLFIIYQNYIFPYDRRMGVFQPVYNALKSGGLQAYMAKAEWGKYSAAEKAKAYMKYGLFFLYIKLGNMRMALRNKQR